LRSSTLPVVAALLGAILTAPASVRADDMDVALSRLRVATGGPGDLPEGCSGTGDNGLPRAFCPDNDAWHRLASQLGFAIAPPVLSPARTTGYGGFYVGLEGWISGIESAEYWRLGTEGDESAASEGRNRFPSRTLLLSRVNVRKGFPFGFELGTSFATLLDTETWVWGLSVQWAILEGYREGLMGFVPDVAVRGMVHTMVGEPEFNLTVPSFDIVISKPLVFSRTGSVTPFVSWQLAWIFGDSELVDLTPGIDAFDECRPDPSRTMTSCGRTGPIPGTSRMPGEDYNNNATFEELRATRQRLAIGVQGRYQAITLSASFAFDLAKPHEQDSDAPEGLPRQWTTAAAVGLTF